MVEDGEDSREREVNAEGELEREGERELPRVMEGVGARDKDTVLEREAEGEVEGDIESVD